MTSFSNIPRGPHFAILRTVSVHIPGDERSRTHPGHGYPAEIQEHISYEAYTSKLDWETEIARCVATNVIFHALSVSPATISVAVKVDIQEGRPAGRPSPDPAI